MKNNRFYLAAKWVLCTCIAIVHLQLFAQKEGIAFEKYGVPEGLPEELVSDVIQDDKGFIWCTTQNGLVKYDGYRFQVYRATSDKTDTNSLQFGNLGGGLVKARDGKIWIGGIYYNAGIACFDPVTEKFRNYYPDADDTVRLTGNPWCFLLLEDKEGNIWFNSFTPPSDKRGICRLSPKTGVIKRYPVNVYRNIYSRTILTGSLRKSSGSIVESSENIWLLDEKGNLNRWNHQRDSFEIVIAAGTALSSHGNADTIRFINKGRDNRLLLTGEHGFYIFDSKNQKLIKNYINSGGTAKSLSSAPIAYAFEDLNGQFWVFHQQGNISLINPVQDSISHLKYGRGALSYDKGPKEIFVFWVSAQNKEGIWFQSLIHTSGSSVLSSGFFLHYNFASKKFRFYDGKFDVSNNSLPLISPPYGFFEDRTGLLWLNTRPNFYKQAPKKRQMDLFRYNPDEPNSLPSDSVVSLFEDSKHRLWIGTRNGLAIYQPGQDNFRVFRHNLLITSSISNSQIRTIAEDADGKIWIGSGNGLNLWLESTSSFRRFSFSAKEKKDTCSLFIDKKQRLWVSVLSKGIYLLDTKTGKVLKTYMPDSKNPSSITNKQINVFFQDSKGNIWLGQRSVNPFGLYRLNEKENGFINYRPIPGDSSSVSDYRIHSFFEDEKRRLWICTNNGLNLYDSENDRFTRYMDLNAYSFAGSVKDLKGNIWIATYAGGGLALLNAESGKMTLYGEKQGLPHNDIAIALLLQSNLKIAMDDSGRLWLPTRRGLSVFDPVTKSFKNYFEKDGFQPYGTNYTEIKTSNGDIWIGGANGLNRIVPADLLKKDSTLASVVITQITIQDSAYTKPDGKIFKKAVAYTDAIRLRHWQKDLGFEFVALHYLRSEDNLYSWKLENYDKDWSAPSHQRTVTYTNLSPGTYIFRVKASNADGAWNEEGASITITILPPWWLTWWAYASYVLLLALAIYLFIRWRTRSLQKEKIILEEKVTERTAELKTSLENLKATQSQLIQQEKMASLGEMTAGIAHEIQNPLNFVNNFSEVNSELITELKDELKKGNVEDAKAIADGINENEQKIIFHGKRAGAIVKGMLQHSRTSSGQKELTDINALADEYLRLAYHGLRAKDKSFNAKIETDLDGSIGKINIIPQDIGRVIINLINNAFYAVNEKNDYLKSSGQEYEPLVTLSTQQTDGKVIIRVKDNGNGIPQKVLDKIFQPFFTTKPAGEGTGLGLSLAYDLITKGHGGELKVETKEGEGTAFTVHLPNT